ncbi:sulfite exporter TauE/SafE family protein [Pelagibaculum spongiae]|uniref:Probable membrane transporter protein n=1 Tax=Pelagibaculum spongiae TaxID=2080658 RepID=A0A2V1H067_9GAMM|nr:sulfite exporter TauE/SafE family protein [Pelagibaculum spongiae]PVZ72396.1 hypothetical protein DC094_05160 [Pelagibaculum spongiae]
MSGFEIWISYFVLGAFAGVIAGLFGVGGGLVIVPALLFLFSFQGMSPEIMTHMAIGTSLATIVFTSLSSIRAHHKKGAIDWSIFTRLAPGILLGSFLGAMLADLLDGDSLKTFFGIFALTIAVQMGVGFKPKPARQLPKSAGMLGAGGVVGTISALVGIGGGSMTVPFLSWCNVPIRNAVAISAAGGFPLALAGALGFVTAGWNDSLLPEMTAGYVYLPALLGVACMSALTAPVGAQLAHSLPQPVLKRIFACFLLLVGSKLLFL